VPQPNCIYQLLAGLIYHESRMLLVRGRCKLTHHLLKEIEEHALALLEAIREMRAYLDDTRQQ